MLLFILLMYKLELLELNVYPFQSNKLLKSNHFKNQWILLYFPKVRFY